MAGKPEIQYVERFYVYGSEAAVKKELEEQVPERHQKKAPSQVRKVYVDLTALIWTAAAILLLAAMIYSAGQLVEMTHQRDIMQQYVSELQTNNGTLKHNYRISYDLDLIRQQAEEIGLVPEDQVETRFIRVTTPEHKHKWTMLENIQWFFEGLFE